MKVYRYCEKYDANFDIKTGNWLEKQCSDKKCCFCAKRPKIHKKHKFQHMDMKYYICR